MMGFLRVFSTKYLARGAARLNPVTAVLQSIELVAKEGAEFLKHSERQDTRREEIDAELKIAKQRIRAQRDVIIQQLRNHQEEKDSRSEMMLECLEQACEADDPEMARAAMQALIAELEDNPLRHLQALDSSGKHAGNSKISSENM